MVGGSAGRRGMVLFRGGGLFEEFEELRLRLALRAWVGLGVLNSVDEFFQFASQFVDAPQPAFVLLSRRLKCCRPLRVVIATIWRGLLQRIVGVAELAVGFDKRVDKAVAACSV